MGNGPPVVVEVMGALGVGVVSAGVQRQVALVEDRELVRVEVVVFREVGPARELDPGGARVPPAPHHEVADAREEALARQLLGAREPRVTRCDRAVAPEELEHRHPPLLGHPAALLKEPGRVRVLEPVHRVAEHDVVHRVQVRILVVVVSRGGAVRQHFVEVGRPHVREHAPAARRILARRGAAELREHRQRRERDPHVVHRLVVAAGRRDEVRGLEHVVERAPDACEKRAHPLRD